VGARSCTWRPHSSCRVCGECASRCLRPTAKRGTLAVWEHIPNPEQREPTTIVATARWKERLSEYDAVALSVGSGLCLDSILPATPTITAGGKEEYKSDDL